MIIDLCIIYYYIINMEHQDWTPVVIRNNSLKKTTTSSSISKRNTSTKYDENGDPITELKKPKLGSSLNLMKSRMVKGFKTQKDLAAKTNGKITEKRIKQLESGQFAFSGMEKNILNRLLNVKL